MKAAIISHAGSYHRKHGQENQDHGIVVHKGTVVAAAVCDGAGSFRYGAEAAKIAAKAAAEFLTEDFPALFAMDGTVARRLLTRKLWLALETYARENAIEARELATTLVAAAMDDAGRCLCFHLGDGMILMRSRNGEIPQMICAPENGLSGEGSTYLTMNCDLFSHLRLTRWKDGALEDLCLMTDGASRCLARRMEGNWQFREFPWEKQKLTEYLNQMEPEDDYSFALLHR